MKTRASALVWLYGSRLDDTRHGGDIDLLIEPQESINLLLRARIKTRLEQTLGLPVDVMVKKPRCHRQSLSLISILHIALVDKGLKVGAIPDAVRWVNVDHLHFGCHPLLFKQGVHHQQAVARHQTIAPSVGMFFCH